MPFQPDLDGGRVFPGGHPFPSPPSGQGGGISQTGFTGVPSNGGVLAFQQATIFPMFNPFTQQTEYHAFDPNSGFDDPVNPSSHSYRVEELNTADAYTIRRIFISYRDLGLVTITATLAGVNDSQSVVSVSKQFQLGNKIPTGAIQTIILNISNTAMNQQLTIFRDKGAGPLSITHVRMIAEITESTT